MCWVKGLIVGTEERESEGRAEISNCYQSGGFYQEFRFTCVCDYEPGFSLTCGHQVTPSERMCGDFSSFPVEKRISK